MDIEKIPHFRKSLLATASFLAAIVTATALPPIVNGTEVPVAAGGVSSSPETAAATVEGFRSARFGMEEADVRKVINSDFKLSGDAVISENNLVQRTSALGITVPDLIAGAGKADVHYVFGTKATS